MENQWKTEGVRKVCNIPKLRGIKESYEWLKQQDPDTELKLRGYKTLIEQGKIPSVRRGRKYLIDIDTLPEAIKHWVESEAIKQEPRIIATQSALPQSATERKRGGGKSGQVKAIG